MSHDSWPTTRLSLLLRVQDPRSDGAWQEFVQRYQPLILDLIRQAFRLQPSDSEDIAQEVLVKVLRAMGTFQYDPTKKFGAWLRTVTRNAVRDAFRAQQLQLDHATGDTKVHQLLASLPDATASISNRLTNSLYDDLLSDAERFVRQRVEEHTWTAYCLLKTDDRAARDVANELGMSIASVYKAKSKVIKMLRTEIAHLMASQSE
ncbi:MAG: sigma-70 family RNA polymerase sigma factor [Planctomycetales bacterium]|nr:sigma-70 family RNA polymerase sigma factor [Planctomycetales bacterium]